MPALCLCFVVHEPYRLRRYTVFDMGQNSVYEDDDRNCDSLLYAARQTYLPMNTILLKLIKRYGRDFRLSVCISGTALDQFEQYAPEVLESFQALAETGNVEFVGDTNPHSMAFLYSREEFILQVEEHAKRLKNLFGKRPTTYRNAELVYNNAMAACLAELGFRTALTEGADQVLGWRSPNYVYTPLNLPDMRLLLRNVTLSMDIGRRFNDRNWDQWPLTADKFASWIHNLEDAEVINLFNDYHIYGLRNSADSGIFNFFEALPGAIMAKPGYYFATCADVAKKLKPVAEIDVPEFISWDEEGRDLNAWLGNDMQKDAVHALYALTKRVRALNLPWLNQDFERLQTADHFHNMSTKWFTVFMPDRPNPFPSPYDAYIAYMNILSDFEMRVNAAEAEAARENTGAKTAKKTVTKPQAKAAKAPAKAVASKAVAPKSGAAKQASAKTSQAKTGAAKPGQAKPKTGTSKAGTSKAGTSKAVRKKAS